MNKIILASASPLRAELISKFGIPYEIIPSNADELINLNKKPCEVAMEIAFKKAVEVSERLIEDSFVIGADTIVVKSQILGKPKSKEEAFNMLKELQGECHKVITGVSIVNKYRNIKILFFEETIVKMRNLSNEKINAYIEIGECMDKAGAYGIQGVGAILIERIEGCYFNVVGLPIMKLSENLEKIGFKIL